MLGGGCESEVLGLCTPAVETEASDAMSMASCWFSCKSGEAALEGDALVWGCAVEPSWEVTPFPGCSAVDDWVACDTIPFSFS